MSRKFTLNALVLGTLILLALLLRVSVALSFPNILAPDEIFQTLEPAHRLTYGNGIVTWEFREGIRSWVFPGVIAGVMRLTAWMGDGSSGYLVGIITFLCLLSLLPILVAFFWGYRTDGLVGAVLTAGVCSVWFELVYFAPKAFNEVVAAHLLLPGVYLGVHGRCFQPRIRLFLTGCLCGLATGLRIQLLPAVAFAVVYICRKDWRGRWLPMVAGILGPLLAFGAVDAFTWSYPFQSFWMNAWINVAEGKSHQYGVFPWYGYLWPFIKNWSLPVIPITLLAIVGARRSPILAWLAIVIVLSHSVLAHKEHRFIYPAILMVIVLAALGTAELVRRYCSRWFSPQRMVMAVLVCLLLWTSTSAVLASRYDCCRTNDRRLSSIVSSILWDVPKTPRWMRYSGNLLAMQQLSRSETLCGVGLLGVAWGWSGGYTYLHHDVPIFVNEHNPNFDQQTSSFNYLVANVPVPPQHQDYALQECWGNTCIYKRPGSCTQTTGYHINHVLEQRGE